MSTFTFFLCLIVAAIGSIRTSTAENGVKFYVLKQGNMILNITNLGARINSFYFPDKHGKPADIFLGFDTVEQFMADKLNFGGIVGRVAQRIGYAQFTLNGTLYNKLPQNEGRTYLNGGPHGYGYVVWNTTEVKESRTSSHITFTYHSFDGETGFPGDLDITVKLTIQHNKLITKMTAKALNKATPINLGQHIVVNLAGHENGNVNKHEVQIFASKVIELGKELLPTGKLVPVKGTPYDFLEPRTVESNGKRLDNKYAINYSLNNNATATNRRLKLAIILHEPESGRRLKIWTTAPTFHFCNSPAVKNEQGKGGVVYNPYFGYALDGQDFPDAVNRKEFPSIIYTKGQVFKRKTVYEFSVSH